MPTFSSPVTGATITGLTSPTYTLVADTAPMEGVTKSSYVSVLGGTQTGVNAHTIAEPFTISWKNPKVLSTPGAVDATGVLRSPSRRNSYGLITRKGAVPVAGQVPRLNVIKTTFDVEAGTEKADPVALKAMLSLHIGALTAWANSINDTLVTGVA